MSGTDTHRMKTFLKTLPSTLGVEVVTPLMDGAGYRELVDALFGVSLLGSTNLIIVQDPQFLAQPTHEQSLDTVRQISAIPSGHFLAIVSTKAVDGRTKVAQALKKVATVQSFDAFKEWEGAKFSEWVKGVASQLGIRFHPKALELVVETVGVDTGVARQLIDTVITYDPNQTEITVDTVIEVLGQRVGSYHRLTEALRRQDKVSIATEVFGLASDDPAKVLGIVSATLHQFAIIRFLTEDGRSADEMAKVVERHPYSVKIAMPDLKRAYTLDGMTTILTRLSQLDIGFKSGQLSGDGMAALLVDCLIQPSN